MAIRSGRLSAVELLLTSIPVDLNNVFDGPSGSHPLATSAHIERAATAFAMCKLLIEKGACVRARANIGKRTALILMVKHRPPFHKKVASLLRASINDTDDKGRTALMYASIGANPFGAPQGNVKIIQYLVNLGADTAAQDDLGLTALNLASEQASNQNVIQLLRSFDG